MNLEQRVDYFPSGLSSRDSFEEPWNQVYLSGLLLLYHESWEETTALILAKQENPILPNTRALYRTTVLTLKRFTRLKRNPHIWWSWPQGILCACLVCRTSRSQLSSRGRRADALQQKDTAHTQPPELRDAKWERGQPLQILAGQPHGTGQAELDTNETYRLTTQQRR